jgi:transcriptional regulator GlxA family with amidase domain
METKQIAFVVYPGLTPLDIIGPLQALAPLSRIDPSYEIVVVAEERGVVETDSVVGLTPSHTFAEVPAPFALVVPGGGRPTLVASGHLPLLDYIGRADMSTEITMSVCTGALILAAAGGLRGRRATTHWAYMDILELLGATPVRARWVEDGKYLTAAGVSAGIDGGLHLAQRLVGDDAAGLIKLGLEYDPDPPLAPIDWDPAVLDGVRPIWRPSLDEVLVDHPHLAKMRV